MSRGHLGEAKAQVLPHLVKELNHTDILLHMLDQGLVVVLGMRIKLYDDGQLVPSDITEAVVELLSGLPLDKARMKKHYNRRVARFV